jgi:hypothetical protein
MKKQAFTMFAMLVLFGSLAVTAQAQTNGTKLIADIPFEFSAGDQKLPAGKYVVTFINPSSDQLVLRIRSIDGHNGTVLLMHPVEGKVKDHAGLLFSRYGDLYFLAQVWPSASSMGMEVPAFRAERKLAREQPGIKRETRSVAVSARK